MQSKLTIPPRWQNRGSTEHGSGKITLSKTGENDHDAAVLHGRALPQTQRCRNRRSAADAAEKTFLPGQTPTDLHCFVIGDGDHLINQISIKHWRNETCTNALDPMRSRCTTG